MTLIKSPYMESLPSLARLARALAEPPLPAPQASASADLDPTWQRAIAAAEPVGPGRDRVTDGPAEPTVPFSYRTSDDLLRHLPEPARDLLRRLDDHATEARDRSVALTAHVHAAEDRAGRVSLDVAAAIRAAGLPEVQSLDDAQRMAASGRFPSHYTEPMVAHVRRIVGEGDRLAEAQGEVARLRERQRQHAAATVPITALRNRIVTALGRSRPPFKPVELPDVPRGKAERTLAEARALAAEAAAEIERLSGPAVHPDDVLAVAAEAVRQHAATAHRFLRRGTAGTVTLDEPTPGHEAGDRAPVRPLALLCGIAPEATAAWIAEAMPTDATLPRLADRGQALASARQRLREAELIERAALRALGDDLTRLAERPEADPLLVLMVEAGR
jgi:hypothetical protein